MTLISELQYQTSLNHAVLSPCRNYRYALSRVWDASQPYVLFICLNPSTADETEDDNTIRRCIGFAKSWGYGGLVMANLFAWRATEPSDMKQQNDPLGDKNDSWLVELASHAGIVVAAWGNDGNFRQRSAQVRALLPDLYYLKMNGTGEPSHPLYLKKTLTPVLWAALADSPVSETDD